VAFLAERRQAVRAALEAAAREAQRRGRLPEGSLPPSTLEAPRAGGRGHLASNLALVLGAALRRPAREVAEAIAAHLEPGAVPDLARVEVAGPGFLNLTFVPGWLAPVVPEILEAGEGYGSSDVGQGRRVLVEFVSANPTGPLNVVNCRAAALGDALVRCLRAAGYRAEAEYYVNDAGGQFVKLALSLEARIRQALGESGPEAEIPEGGYPGEYVLDLAREWLQTEGPGILARPRAERVERLGRFAVERILAEQLAVLERFGVRYDHVTRESAIRAAGGPEAVVSALQAAGYAYERDGVVWFRSKDLGDSEDRVLRKADGEFTYRVPDIAYHLEKFRRGYDVLIDIFGQDHHGEVPAVRAALQVLGQPVERLEVLFTQMVRLVRDGREVRISKRGGTFVTMEEFVEDVGVDAARFFFLMRSPDTHFDFDLDLARRESQENPVYYVQYAHARIASILRQAPGAEAAARRADARLLTHPAEEELLGRLAAFPDEVVAAAEGRAPHRLTAYARQTAERFHTFYVQCRVLGEAPELSAARLALCLATKLVLARTLGLLGVAAPERM
jgi:arginyl-tRNA synthetase